MRLQPRMAIGAWHRPGRRFFTVLPPPGVPAMRLSCSVVDPSAVPPPCLLAPAVALPLLGVKPAIMPYLAASSGSLGFARFSAVRGSPSASASRLPAVCRSKHEGDGNQEASASDVHQSSIAEAQEVARSLPRILRKYCSSESRRS